MYYHDKKRLDDKAIDELIGLSKGIIADNKVNHDEAKFLRSWMEVNVPCSEDRMVNRLYCRVQEMLVDGIFDQDERQELLSLLKMFSGDTSSVETSVNLSATLPLDSPPPDVNFENSIFCLTGKFTYGPRRICEDVVAERGGAHRKSVSGLVDYLVVGFFATPEWAHTSYGRKIEKAVELRERGTGISIISEDHWAEMAFQNTG